MMVLVPYWELMQQPRLQAELVHDPLRLPGSPWAPAPVELQRLARRHNCHGLLVVGILVIEKAEKVHNIPLFIYEY
jgi:hypothetical protein